MKDKISSLINEKYGDLRKSEKKTADYFLSHLEEIGEMLLEKLALACSVSQPTVMRTIKALGFGGYKEVCHAVLVELARYDTAEAKELKPMFGYSLTPMDRPEDIPRKVVSIAVNRMEDHLRNLSTKTFRQLIDVLRSANLIDIYSVENSNVTAINLLTKLLYLGMQCRPLMIIIIRELVQET